MSMRFKIKDGICVIPEGVIEIYDEEFQNCTDLVEVVLPQSVEKIGSYAFCNCGSLERVDLKSKNVSVEEYAFVGCESLQEINVFGYMAYMMNALEGIPESVLKFLNEKNKKFYWTECSGISDRILAKNGCSMMPAEKASELLCVPVKVKQDGYHYIREVNGDEQCKVVYILDEASFKMVVGMREEIIRSGICFIHSLENLSELEVAVAVINIFVDERLEEECYEFPESMLMVLKRNIETAAYLVNDRALKTDIVRLAKQAIMNGTDLLKTSSVIKMCPYSKE